MNTNVIWSVPHASTETLAGDRNSQTNYKKRLEGS